MPPLFFVGLTAGLVAGLAVGWLVGSRRAQPSDGRIEKELRDQISERDRQVEKLRGDAAGMLEARSAAAAGLEAANRLLAERQAGYERQLADMRQAQDKALADLRETFKALSADALKQNAPEFLRLANETMGKFHETAKGDLAQRQESIAGMLKPLAEQLRIYQERLQASDGAQAKAIGEVGKHLETLAKQSESLASETLQFRMVLKSSQARGRWGEETLRRVVEAAGMSAHCDFVEQASSDESRPDMVVRLPGGRQIIVDAKVPDLDFLAALDISDLEKRRDALAAHAQKLRATVTALSRRGYAAQFPGSLDYVVLFLPAESLFSAALEGDRELIVWAANQQVMLATPASLIALLRAVSISWLQHAQTENATAIAQAAQELYSRVAKFTEHFEKIRDSLVKAAEAYNQAVGSYESRVRPGGEKLIELGAVSAERGLAPLELLDTNLRLPPAGRSGG